MCGDLRRATTRSSSRGRPPRVQKPRPQAHERAGAITYALGMGHIAHAKVPLSMLLETIRLNVEHDGNTEITQDTIEN